MDRKKLKSNIINVFLSITTFIENSNADDDSVREILLIFFHFMFLLKKLCNSVNEHINKFIKYRVEYATQLDNILNELVVIDQNTIEKYNSIFYQDNKITHTDIVNSYEKHRTTNKKLYNVKSNTNLELEDIHTLLFTDKNTNSDYIDIGYGNMYKLNIYNSIHDDIPLNLLVYIKQLDQVVMKVGNEKKYQFVNSKLYKVYNPRNKIDNDRSIICNNNIKKLNKKCQNGVRCRYYHDPIIGYEDNYHINRQFSSNPIIYNCIDFKDGARVKENIKKFDWYDAINLYQSSLSVILIACIHSTQEI